MMDDGMPVDIHQKKKILGVELIHTNYTLAGKFLIKIIQFRWFAW